MQIKTAKDLSVGHKKVRNQFSPKFNERWLWTDSYLMNVVRAIWMSKTDQCLAFRLFQASTSFTWSSATYFICLATFATYVLSDPESNVLNPEKAFLSLSIFNILQLPMTMLPWVVYGLVQVFLSIKRSHWSPSFVQSSVLDSIFMKMVFITVIESHICWQIKGVQI